VFYARWDTKKAEISVAQDANLVIQKLNFTPNDEIRNDLVIALQSDNGCFGNFCQKRDLIIFLIHDTMKWKTRIAMKGERKTMTNKNISGQVFSPKQARYKIVERLAELSPEALKELLVFIDFLRFREQANDQPDKKIVKLEGIWKDVPFDITDDDIRQVRHDLTQQLRKRSEAI